MNRMNRHLLTALRIILALYVGVGVGDADPSPNATKPKHGEVTASKDVLQLREVCLKDIERARKNPACRPFLPPESPEPTETTPTPPLRLCKDKGSSDTPSCRCDTNGLDARCKFRICGYLPGFYSDP